MPPDRPGQVDFPVKQVTFHAHFPNRQESRQVFVLKSIYQLTREKQNQEKGTRASIQGFY